MSKLAIALLLLATAVQSAFASGLNLICYSEKAVG